MEKETIEVMDNLKEVCENLLKKVVEMENQQNEMMLFFTAKLHQMDMNQSCGGGYPLDLALKDVKEGVAK